MIHQVTISWVFWCSMIFSHRSSRPSPLDSPRRPRQRPYLGESPNASVEHDQWPMVIRLLVKETKLHLNHDWRKSRWWMFMIQSSGVLKLPIFGRSNNGSMHIYVCKLWVMWAVFFGGWLFVSWVLGGLEKMYSWFCSVTYKKPNFAVAQKWRQLNHNPKTLWSPIIQPLRANHSRTI